jgi:hypothetical protein
VTGAGAGAPGGDGYTVDPGGLGQHAGTVGTLADTLGQAVQAATSVTIGVQAYGLICGPLFVPIVTAVSAPAVLALQRGEAEVRSIATALGETATGYQAIDDQHAGSFDQIAPGSPG